jgi:hypothetical protein
MSTTNPTQPDLGMIPGCCGEKPVTNCMSYGMAQKACQSSYKVMLNTLSIYENQNSLTIFCKILKYKISLKSIQWFPSCFMYTNREKLNRHSAGLWMHLKRGRKHCSSKKTLIPNPSLWTHKWTWFWIPRIERLQH